MPGNFSEFKPLGKPSVISRASEPRMFLVSKIKLALKTKSILTNPMTSWKMKLGGLLVALSTASHLLPAGWEWLSGAMGTVGGLLLATGRDNNVTSEQAGAKP